MTTPKPDAVLWLLVLAMVVAGIAALRYQKTAATRGRHVRDLKKAVGDRDQAFQVRDRAIRWRDEEARHLAERRVPVLMNGLWQGQHTEAPGPLHYQELADMWLNACGKFPSWRCWTGSYSSARSPRSLRSARRRSNKVRASSRRPVRAKASTSQKEQRMKVPSSLHGRWARAPIPDHRQVSRGGRPDWLLHQLAAQSSRHRGTVVVPAPRSTSGSTRQTCTSLTSQQA
ncbi:hypothetical protein EES39_09440 [Streptomyces sp. ADI92-24]|nr:hypothetical protein EES39_09440 [Streptomyces sp. ADI92-24]